MGGGQSEGVNDICDDSVKMVNEISWMTVRRVNDMGGQVKDVN